MNQKIIHKKPNWMRGFAYFLRCRARRIPPLLNLEFTKRCNAKCVFCQYWQLESPDELADFGPIVKRFRPVVVSISGGEPLMRKDCADLIRGIRPYTHYLSMVSNGALMNEEKAALLVSAGIDHISISLDYLNERHDEARQIPGLYDHLSAMIPKLSAGGHRISLNTIIMESNLDQILPIAYRAKEWGVSVSYSAYCTLKKDDDQQMVRQKRLEQLRHIISELKRLKGKLRNIRNSDYYLEHVSQYFRDGYVRNCKAGLRWLHVTPDGYIQQCSEMPRICYYTEFTRESVVLPSCAKCWYTCRGEAEAPLLAPKRFLEFIRS